MSKVNNKKKEKMELSGDIDFIKIVEDYSPDIEKGPQEEQLLNFFCRNCRKIIEKPEVQKKGKISSNVCPECKDQLVRGTQRSLDSYYKL